MKKSIFISAIIFIIFSLTMAISSCTTSKAVADKSGAQLWAENCNRCHNAPGPGEFSNEHWEIVGMHMQVRANISQADVNKIVDFLKGANN